jgi:hypothetical protein
VAKGNGSKNVATCFAICGHFYWVGAKK